MAQTSPTPVSGVSHQSNLFNHVTDDSGPWELVFDSGFLLLQLLLKQVV